MAKYLKHLRKELWYHGTTLEGWKQLCDKKINVEYNKGNELDFGYGFYLTPSIEQAEEYIQKIIEVRKDETDYLNIEGLEEIVDIESLVAEKNNEKDAEIPVVIEFEFCPMEYYETEWEFQIFSRYDDDFAEFVFHNRINNLMGVAQHKNDLIFGVMSDSKPIFLTSDYRNGKIDKPAVIEGLKKSTSSKQLSIHNQEICDKLKVTKVYLVNTKEELNKNDYNN